MSKISLVRNFEKSDSIETAITGIVNLESLFSKTTTTKINGVDAWKASSLKTLIDFISSNKEYDIELGFSKWTKNIEEIYNQLSPTIVEPIINSEKLDFLDLPSNFKSKTIEQKYSMINMLMNERNLTVQDWVNINLSINTGLINIDHVIAQLMFKEGYNG